MQFSQVCRQYRILDLKTIVEYCANMDGHEKARLAGGQSLAEVVNSDRFLSTPGGALFSFLQRIPVVDFYPGLENAEYVGSQPDRTLQSIQDFFDYLKSEDFISLVSTNREAIMHNSFVKPLWTADTFDAAYNVLFANIDSYKAYIDYIYDKVCTQLIDIELKDDTILSLYAEIPQLEQGIMNRLKRASPDIFASQPGIHADAFMAFKRYLKEVSFAAESNETTVVEGYIGYILKFFINSDFRAFLAEYQTPRALVFEGEDGEAQFANDFIRLDIDIPNSTTNLAEVFKEVESIDYAFFGRKKTSVVKTMVPYASIMDFVSEVLIRPKTETVNTLLKGCSATKSFMLQVVPAYRGDLQLIADGVDQSFKDRISQGKSILQSIFTTLKEISTGTLGEACRSIILSNSRAASLRKDSNFNIIPNTNIECEEGVFYSDDSYEVIKRIINILNQLFKLNSELESYNTSLQFLWFSYIKGNPQRGIDIFKTHSTVASYLSYVLSQQHNESKDLVDKYGDTLQPLNLYIQEKTRQLYLQMLSIPFVKQVAFQDISSISTARLHKATNLEGTPLVDTLYKNFLQIKTDAFEPEFEFCKQEHVVPFELCKLIYKDLLRVPIYFRTPEMKEEPLDDLVENTLIDYVAGYELSTRNISMSEYCLTMAKLAIEHMTEDSWNFFVSNFSSLCIALYEIAPRGELDSEVSMNTSLFSFCWQVPCVPHLAEAETHKFIEWIDTATQFILPTSGVFHIDSFKHFASSINVEELEGIINAPLEGDNSVIANTFALQWFLGAFEILWRMVDNSYKYNSLEVSVSPFCDNKLITDLAFSEIHMLSDIGETYLEYMEIFRTHLHTAEALTKNSFSSKYSVSKALELQKISSKYKSIKVTFFDQLRSCCDCAFMHSANFQGVELLEMSLREANVLSNLTYHPSFGYEQDYMNLVTNQLCGCIRWFILDGNIAQTLTVMDCLLANEQQINAFLLASVALANSKHIPRSSKPIDPYYLGQTARLTRAFKTSSYKECLLYNKNTDIKIMNDFRNLLLAVQIDENGFCYTTSGKYITAYTIDETCCYLSKDGVWVGFEADNRPICTMAYAELKMET